MAVCRYRFDGLGLDSVGFSWVFYIIAVVQKIRGNFRGKIVLAALQGSAFRFLGDFPNSIGR